MSYRYRHGESPLDGYTVLRGLGRGGFGEVYYARSDSGREVALKVIQQNADIELRGVRECMNLKSPHLVTIFDVKTPENGPPFVIMEYITGPSLRNILRESPKGVGIARTAYIVKEIATGLAYLHDNGLVHRDLKPENIFYESPFMKIGDYGLAKSMNVSRHSGQTISVGTVHYMAPEIGSGNYSRSVDIYSLGVMFYELLTGTVPFDGESTAEVLMKHLTEAPDLSAIELELRPVLEKALAKNPGERFEHVNDVVDAMLAIAGIADQLALLPADTLTGFKSVTAADSADEASVGEPLEPSQVPDEVAAPVETAAEPESIDAPDGEPAKSPARTTPVLTKAEFRGIQGSRRLFLGALTSVVMATALGFFVGEQGLMPLLGFAIVIVSGALSVYFVERWFAPRYQIDMGIARRLVILAFVGSALCCSLKLLEFFISDVSGFQASLLAFFLSIVVLNWQPRIAPDRKEQFSLSQAFSAGLFGFLSASLVNGSAVFTAGILAAMSLVLNAIARFQPTGVQAKGFGSKFLPVDARTPPFLHQPRNLLAAILLISGMVLYVLVGFHVAAACLLAVPFLLSREDTPVAGNAGWVAVGTLLMAIAVFVAISGTLLASDIEIGTVRGMSIEAIENVREFVRTNGHMVIAILLFTPAVVCLLLARRWAGPMHVLRGAAGWATAAVLVADVASSISQKIAHDTFSTPFLRLLVLGILSAVFLAWPGTAIQTHGRPSRTHDNSAGTGGAGQATRS